MANLTKEQTLNQALLDYRASLPKPDNDVIVDDKTKTNWKLGNWSGGINPNGMYTGGNYNINQPKPTDSQAQEELEKAQLDKLNSAKLQAQVQSKTMTKMHIGLFVGGVVVGYFLLKMLKK